MFISRSDNHNDVWKPIVKDIVEISITIHSRWGQVVHSYEGNWRDSVGWKGDIGSNESSEGVYYVAVKGRARTGQIVEASGSIGLYR